MENKSGSGARAGAMGGKGFYIVLFLCAAVIGVSAWILLAGVGTNVEQAAEKNVDVSAAIVTTVPAGTPMETEEEVTETMTEKTEIITDDELQEVFSETVVSYVWPVQGDVDVPYALETLLYDSTMADWRTHNGIDIACNIGEQVMAAAGGTVVSVLQDDLAGTTVEIDHANGIHTVYSNLASQPTVGEGDLVTMGQVIGAVGDTALGETNQTPHLHFSMKQNGIYTNPLEFLPAK